MPNILADEKDVRFALFDVLKVQELSKTEAFASFTQDVMEMIIAEALKFAENVLFPLNLKGDKEGARFVDGRVFSTPGTAEAYRALADSGWLTARESEDLGGQGMPNVLNVIADELFLSSNFPLMTTAHVTHDGAKLIELFGTEEQKHLYMEKMYGGQWTGTMVLTESGAGSDLGAIQTKATRRGDGTYTISGSKLFITGGDSDVTENIVHLILARIEGDPPGTKGLSIFIVPKIIVNSDGSLSGVPNDIVCTRIEEKLGLHASPTCQMTFGENNDCIGYLLGKERAGINIMFGLINPSRLGIGAWGTGTASIAYLHALRYAKERIQGGALDNPRNRVAIINHPDIRRILLTMKAYTEGMRVFVYYLSYALDLSRVSSSAEERERWSGTVDLLIPVLKAYCSEKGFEMANLAVQIHGGYGLSAEYPVEQLMRDVRTATIVEGTTGIQGMDLVFRKLPMEGGAVFADFLAAMDDVAGKMAGRAGWQAYIDQFKRTKAGLAEMPAAFSRQTAEGNKVFPYLKANLFLEAFGDVIMGWFLLRSALVAEERLEALCREKGATDAASRDALTAGDMDAVFFQGKILTAKHFIGTMLPVTEGKLASIAWNDLSAWEIVERAFGG